MTSVRSASMRMTPKSWLTTSMLTLKSRLICWMRSSTAACTDRSSPVVTSSSSRMGGLFDSALAICTRCCMPPEKLRGGSAARVSGMFTRVSSSSPRPRMTPTLRLPAAIICSAMFDRLEKSMRSPR